MQQGAEREGVDRGWLVVSVAVVMKLHHPESLVASAVRALRVAQESQVAASASSQRRHCS